jgi:hypothetical protein
LILAEIFLIILPSVCMLYFFYLDFMELTEFCGGRLLHVDAGDLSEEADPEKDISVPRLPKSFAVFRTQFSAPEPSPQRMSVTIKGEK